MKPRSGPPQRHGRLQRLRTAVRESQGSTGVGERRDSARLRNSYFSRCLDKPVVSDTSARSGWAPSQVAGWHVASSKARRS